MYIHYDRKLIMRGKPIDQGTATRMGQRIEAIVVSYEVRHIPMYV